MPDLKIIVNDETFSAAWVDRNHKTREAVREALPLEGRGSRWGDELYFETPVDVAEGDSSEEVPVGGVAYWPDGNAVCVFWGPTPASSGSDPRAASPVNLFAKIQDVTGLEELDGDAEMRVEEW